MLFIYYASLVLAFILIVCPVIGLCNALLLGHPSSDYLEALWEGVAVVLLFIAICCIIMWLIHCLVWVIYEN